MSRKKLSKIRRADPFLERELARYEFPLPSREYILQIMEREARPLEGEEIALLLDISSGEREMFQRRLAAMEREGQLMRNRKGAYLMPEKASLIAGRIQGHPDGYGFLVSDQGDEDIFLDQRQMARALHGDRALVRVTGTDRRGRKEGAIVEVTERANQKVIGRVYVEHGVSFVIPENRRIAQDILIPPVPEGGLKPAPGQVVMVEVVEQPNKFSQPIGRITEVIGNYADPGMEIEIALRKHDLPFVFSPMAEVENSKIPSRVRKADLAGREDLRGLPLVTIDGETARDFDDAVYCEKQGRGWRLVVAIADVSHYVRPGMALDREARERGNSVYFPRRVIPMLPEKLSNGICSLNPEVDRLAMVCDVEISATGKLGNYRFYPAVFRSQARLTYEQVWSWLSGAVRPDEPAHIDLQPHLANLYKLYQVLHKARGKRGAIDFETTETRMLFNAQGKIENIVPVVRNDAHRLIEECMLAANVCASDFLARHKHPCLYRIHDAPTEEKLDNLRAFLAEFGLDLGGGEEPTAKDYGKLLEQIKPRPDFALLQTVMLRSLQQAIYSPDNVGHFGLAYEHYTHFTSPIRRYPDLLVHRAIKAVLAGEKYLPDVSWENVGLQCSATERRADEATRDVENWLKCFYMKERISETFDGSISAVTSFGIFVALDAVYVEGLVHVSELGADYFQFDAVRHQMLGERTGQRFRLGDRVRVRLVRVDLENNKIDFVLADRDDRGARPARQNGTSNPAPTPRSRQRPPPSPASVGAMPPAPVLPEAAAQPSAASGPEGQKSGKKPVKAKADKARSGKAKSGKAKSAKPGKAKGAKADGKRKGSPRG